MRYIRTEDYIKADRVTNGAFESNGNIAKNGSVSGMQKLYGWPKGGQVRCGAYIYNVGVTAVNTLRDRGLLKE